MFAIIWIWSTLTDNYNNSHWFANKSTSVTISAYPRIINAHYFPFKMVMNTQITTRGTHKKIQKIILSIDLPSASQMWINNSVLQYIHTYFRILIEFSKSNPRTDYEMKLQLPAPWVFTVNLYDECVTDNLNWIEFSKN